MMFKNLILLYTLAADFIHRVRYVCFKVNLLRYDLVICML